MPIQRRQNNNNKTTATKNKSVNGYDTTTLKNSNLSF